MLVASYEETFEWIDFPQGRVRYAGTARGRDEPPINVFAVEILGSIHHGEIKRNFFSDGARFDVEIVSFGWFKEDWCGTVPVPAYSAAFTASQINDVQALICQAVAIWDQMANKPSFLSSTKACFTGDIAFREGWVLVKEGGSAR